METTINKKQVEKVITKVYNIFIKNGISEENAKARLLHTEPYNQFEDFINNL